MWRPAGGTHSCCLHSDLGTQRHPAHTSYIQRSTTAPSAQEAWVPLSQCWLGAGCSGRSRFLPLGAPASSPALTEAAVGSVTLEGSRNRPSPVSLLPQDFPKDRCLFQELSPFLSPLPATWRLEDLLPFIIYLLTVYHVPLIRHHY